MTHAEHGTAEVWLDDIEDRKAEGWVEPGFQALPQEVKEAVSKIDKRSKAYRDSKAG